MPKKKEQKGGPAYQWIATLYDQALAATGHSWTRLNGALYEAVNIAIGAGLTFKPDDVGLMMDNLQGGYWFHDSNGEDWFKTAVEVNNLSACQSLEKYLGRGPFMFNGKRLYVGAQLTWEREVVYVTSFDNLGEYVTAVKYKVVGRGGNSFKSAIAKRYKITLEELRKGERAKAPPKPLPHIKRMVDALVPSGRCGRNERLRRDLLKAQSFAEAWKIVTNPDQRLHAYDVRQAIIALGYDGPYKVVQGWNSIADIVRDVDFERDLAPLLEKYTKKKPKPAAAEVGAA